jgi:LysM repeat protein
MNILRWLPIFSTTIWLFTSAVGTKANSDRFVSLSSLTQTATQASHSTSPDGIPAKVVAQAIAQTPAQRSTLSPADVCPPPVLSRLTRHKVAAGETLESIAQQYNLVPATLLSVNPSLKKGSPPVGREILIPPFNGIRVQAPAPLRGEGLSGSPFREKRLRPLSSPLLGENERGGKGAGGLGFPCFANSITIVASMLLDGLILARLMKNRRLKILAVIPILSEAALFS